MPRFRLRTLFLIVLLVSLALGVFLNWERIPGTFYRDANGFPHGTGTATYNYDSGELMIRELYYCGLIYRSTWYRPDGTEIAIEEYDKHSGGVGYYLRQDGSIRSKYSYAYSPTDDTYFAHGEVTEYNVDGSVKSTAQYINGSEVQPESE